MATNNRASNMQSGEANNTSTTFLNLPSKIRKTIFRHLFRGTHLWLWHDHDKQHARIRPCRDFRAAAGVLATARGVFYQAYPVAIAFCTLKCADKEFDVRHIPHQIRSGLRNIFMAHPAVTPLRTNPFDLKAIFPEIQHVHLGIHFLTHLHLLRHIVIDAKDEQEVFDAVALHSRSIGLHYDLKLHFVLTNLQTFFTMSWIELPETYCTDCWGLCYKRMTVLWNKKRFLRYFDFEVPRDKKTNRIDDKPAQDILLGLAKPLPPVPPGLFQCRNDHFSMCEVDKVRVRTEFYTQYLTRVNSQASHSG